MPRMPRKKSESGYFHVVNKGTGSVILFVERADYIRYLHLLKQYAEKFNISLHAYCLMDNHTHLLVCDKFDNLTTFMRKLDSVYAAYYNYKYQRTGHVFLDRFKSKPIENEEYLLTAFHYILNNPGKANLCRAADYEWSSYHKYGLKRSFVDTGIFCELLGDWDDYEAYLATEQNEGYFEYDSVKRDDAWALEVIRETFGVVSGTEISSWPQEKRNAALRLLREKGLSIRQIERLTRITRGVIQRA